MSKISNVPQIRFKEFTDAWEQRKLGDVCEITTGRLDANAMVPNGAYDFYTSGIAKYKIDVPAFSGPAITIAGNGATVGFMHLADGLFNAYQRTYVLSNFVADRHYLFCEIGNKLPVKIAQEARTGNIPYIVMEMLTGLKLYIPASDEQNSIGMYFEKIDNLITLHQRKYDQVVNFKKAMLEKMFPKNGSRIPEIRFKGYTGAWELRKFGDIGTVAMCKRVFKEETSENGDVPFYKIGTFGGEADAYITREMFEKYKNMYPYPQKGDILISASGSIGRTVEYTGKDEYFQDSNIVWLQHNKNIDNSFLKVLYNVVQWSCEGSTIKRLYNDNFLKTEIVIPNIKEQSQIGEYFENLDNLIALHQRKLQQLKNIKKALLEKMFV
jgi:type I restriction-modification system specificity subunit